MSSTYVIVAVAFWLNSAESSPVEKELDTVTAKHSHID